MANHAWNPGHLSPDQWHFLSPRPFSSITRTLGAQTSWSCGLSSPPACSWLVLAAGQCLNLWWSTTWSTCPSVCVSSVQLPWSAGEFHELKIHQCFHLPSCYLIVLQSNHSKFPSTETWHTAWQSQMQFSHWKWLLTFDLCVKTTMHKSHDSDLWLDSQMIDCHLWPHDTPAFYKSRKCHGLKAIRVWEKSSKCGLVYISVQHFVGRSEPQAV